jgi:hypothetical protein
MGELAGLGLFAKGAATTAAKAAAAKAISGAALTKGALALAPSVISLAGQKRGGAERPKQRPAIDREAAEAADRERVRRARQGERSTILTGPAGAPGSALRGRTILSGG